MPRAINQRRQRAGLARSWHPAPTARLTGSVLWTGEDLLLQADKGRAEKAAHPAGRLRNKCSLSALLGGKAERGAGWAGSL